MSHFSANLSMLFGEYSFLARFEEAAQYGFRSAEFTLPYDYDIEELEQVLAGNKLEHMLHDLPTGDWVMGEWGIVCIPGRKEELWDDMTVAIRYARALGNKKINCLIGRTSTGLSSEQIHTTSVENLCYAADMLIKEDILLLTEPINHFDTPGFHLIGARQALELIDDADCCNLGIQYDVYHMWRTGGESTNTVTRWADKIGHL